jgi:hypothetical protein
MVVRTIFTDRGVSLHTNTCTQRSHGASAGPVAMDLLNQDVIGGVLDGDTFVFVRDLFFFLD